jgi:hypothetical protein
MEQTMSMQRHLDWSQAMHELQRPRKAPRSTSERLAEITALKDAVAKLSAAQEVASRLVATVCADTKNRSVIMHLAVAFARVALLSRPGTLTWGQAMARGLREAWARVRYARERYARERRAA